MALGFRLGVERWDHSLQALNAYKNTFLPAPVDAGAVGVALYSLPW